MYGHHDGNCGHDHHHDRDRIWILPIYGPSRSAPPRRPREPSRALPWVMMFIVITALVAMCSPPHA